MGTRRSFGRLRKLPSGRFQAGYIAPTGELIRAPATFAAKIDAEGWLAQQQRSIDLGIWRHPDDVAVEAPRQSLEQYAQVWLSQRPLRHTTRELYGRRLRIDILPDLGSLYLDQITPAIVRSWYASLPEDQPAKRAGAYALLRLILGTAHEDEIIESQPARIRGASQFRPSHQVVVATEQEIETILEHLPDWLQPMLHLALFCALRYGEAVELRRKDIDIEQKVIHVRRGFTKTRGNAHVGPPKTAAGIRDVPIPPHIVPVLEEHLAQRVEPGADALLFPSPHGKHLPTATHYSYWNPARKAAGRPDLRWHDLRHSGAVLAAQAGATVAELMALLGHSDPAMAIRYQHVATGRGALIAGRVSEMFTGRNGS